MRISPTLTSLLGSVLIMTTGQAQEGRVERGRTFAETHCASCHAIGRSGDSPLSAAPPFRSFHFRYPNEDLAEALAKAHQVMPQFQELDGATVLDLATYLRAIDRN
jgi:cytochrome c